MMHKAVLLDTSFFLRFLHENSALFSNADGYFKYFLQNDIKMFILTISIAEYCVGGDINELPLKNLQIIPFNLDHSKKTGEFAKIVFQNKNKLQIRERNLIPNDTKLFATADIEKNIELMNPVNVLKRGFSITLINGKVLKEVADVREGDILKTIISDGEITSVAKKIDKTE